MGIEKASRGKKPKTSPVNEQALCLRDIVIFCLGNSLFAQKNIEPVGAEQHYLYAQFLPLRGLGDPDAAIDALIKAPTESDQSLVELARILSLSHVELIMVALTLLVEEEPMMGRLVAFIQAPIGGSRPTLGLLQTILSPLNRQAMWMNGSLLSGGAVTSGAIEILNTHLPIPEQSVRMPTGLMMALRNCPLIWPGVETFSDDRPIQLPLSMIDVINEHCASLRKEENAVLVIRGTSTSELRTIASEMATHLDRQPVRISQLKENIAGLGIACEVSNCLPVFELTLSADELGHIPLMPFYSGPILVLLGSEGHVASEIGSVIQWEVSPPTQTERYQLWNEYLRNETLAKKLATDHIHTAGRIAELARIAKREATLRKSDSVELSDIRHAAWEAESGQLGSLAQAIKTEIPDEAFVLSKPVSLELQQLLARCHTRESLSDSLGVTIKARYQQGVRCLFVGPSGTGKTLASSWLATRLGLPLYRVDLASVVSKYIGETEKNLASLMARAEHSEVVLLFDEADSLFGKRTDIKDSNDRFANSQTNYLLQRIEFYRGIVILTSNSRDRFDSAFTRRLDKIVEFPQPSPQERRAIWHTHLGNTHALSSKQINQLAAGCDLSGGFIRNAVLTAAVEAKDNDRTIVYRDVVIGLLSEYKKLGRQFPAELRQFEHA